MRNIDNISSMPDEILCHILSFLPTKDAFRTSILSSRWPELMTFVPILNFESPSLPPLTPSFISTLNRVLNKKSRAKLQRLKLNITDPDWDNIVPRVNDWISSAIKRNVITLDVKVPDYVSNGIIKHELALHITASDSLQKLKISGGLGFRMPCTTKSFKNLTTFKIKLNDPDEELLGKLFCSLPQLEKLSIEIKFSLFLKKDINISINIIVPTLKRLSFCIRQDEIDNVDSTILIDAPLLEYVSIHEDYLATYLVKRPPAVVEAALDVCWKYEDVPDENRFHRVIRLLEGFSNAKSLLLLGGTSIAVDSVDSELPLLHGVTYLELHDLWLSGLAQIPSFLKRAPNLRKVVLTILEEIDTDEAFHWDSLETVPNLEEFEIIGADLIGVAPYQEMVNYIYQNAKHLKKFLIDGNEWVFLGFGDVLVSLF